MDLARAPCRAARKKGSGYENASGPLASLSQAQARVALQAWAWGRGWPLGVKYSGDQKSLEIFQYTKPFNNNYKQHIFKKIIIITYLPLFHNFPQQIQ
jgi:hypothetical protein